MAVEGFRACRFPWVAAACAAALAVILCPARPAAAAVSLFDDFSDRTLNAYGFSRTTGGSPGTLHLNYASLTTTPKPRGNQGFSLELSYDVSMTGGFVYFIDPVSASSADLSAHKYLSFWVRGAVGGEGFLVGLGNNTPVFFEPKVQVNDWLPGGVTTAWKKVVIPINVLDNLDANFNPATINKVAIVMTKGQYGAETGTVYLDDLVFGPAAPDLWIDAHDNGADPNACLASNFGWGSGFAASYLAMTYTGQAPYVWRCDYTAGSGSGGFTHALPSGAGGVDASAVTTLEFDLRGGPGGGQTPGVRIRSGGSDYAVNLSSYLTPVDGAFLHAVIPLAAFSAPANLAAVTEITFDENAIPPSRFDLDNLVLRNRAAPAAPAAATSFTFAGQALYPGFAVYECGSVSATAASLLDDPKLEGVGFEVSADGGATWSALGADYATSASKTVYGVFWDSAAWPRGAYCLRVTPFHADGAEGPALTVAVNLTDGTPTFTPTFTRTATPTATPSSTPTATPTATSTASPSATPSATPSRTRTPTPSATGTATPSATPSASATATPSPTASATPTASRTASATATPSATATRSATLTGTATATPSASATPTATASVSRTVTPTVSLTPTESATATASASRTATPTVSLTPTASATATAAPSPAATATATQIPDVAAAGAWIAYPNPGRGSVRFLAADSGSGVLSIRLFNSCGEFVAELVSTGGQTPVWDCRRAAPGVYFAHWIRDGKVWARRKIAVVK